VKLKLQNKWLARNPVLAGDLEHKLQSKNTQQQGKLYPKNENYVIIHNDSILALSLQ